MSDSPVDPYDPAFSDPDVDPAGFPQHGDGEAAANEADAAADAADDEAGSWRR